MKNLTGKYNDIIKEFGLNNSKPSKSFERRLRANFLKKSGVSFSFSFIYINTLRFKFVLLFLILISSGIYLTFRLNTSNQSKVYASTIEEVFKSNPQSALMPIFTGFSLNRSNLEEAMNISKIPFDKSAYSSSVTTNILYGESYDKCSDLFKFDRNISKIVTFEYFNDPVYKFKTHVFDSSNNEIDLLVFDGKNYLKSNTFELLAQNSIDLNTYVSYVPSEIYSNNQDRLSWKKDVDCNPGKLDIVYTLEFDTNSKLKSYEVTDSKSGGLIYRVNFEISDLTKQDLELIDAMFNS